LTDLAERASKINSISRLSDALRSFRCCLDEDIETFLRQKALTFLHRGWCSIYLILDEEAFDAGQLVIIAYFTLSHKSLIPDYASKEKVKAASGFKDTSSVHFVLIGQLGKYIARAGDGRLVAASISASEILDYAFEIIRSSSALIPCRCVLVECTDNTKVHKVYTNYAFSLFQRDGGLYQFYKRL